MYPRETLYEEGTGTNYVFCY